MKNFTVGVDVSKDKLDFCILSVLDYSVVKKGVIENTKKGITDWLKKLNPEEFEISLEHTGNYGAMLSWMASESSFVFYMINPLELKRSIGIQRGKSDSIDAYRIAAYTIGNKHRIKPYKLPSEKLRKLKALITSREHFVKIIVQLKNSLKANEILHKTIFIKELLKAEKKHIESIGKTILSIEDQMMSIISLSQELNKSYQKVIGVIGVGPITAIYCISETDNFLKFYNPRKFSCHCGLAPFPYQSGSSIKGRTKTHYFRKKQLKAILFKAACSSIQHDPQLKAYYNKKLKEGKHKLSVINAVANKLVLRIFAVVNREESFVKLAA